MPSLQKILPVSFDVPLFINLSISFMLCTVLGTVLHELGHIAMAEYFGAQTVLHHDHMSYYYPNNSTSLKSAHIITAGGPLSTWLISLMGAGLLYGKRKKIYSLSFLNWHHWLYVLLCLFCLRATFNGTMDLYCYFTKGSFSKRSDENRLSLVYNFPIATIEIITMLMGAALLSWVTFKIIPPTERFTFLVAGLIGGCLGYYLWIVKYGALLLP